MYICIYVYANKVNNLKWCEKTYHMNSWDSTNQHHMALDTEVQCMGVPKNCLDPLWIHYFMSLCQEWSQIGPASQGLIPPDAVTNRPAENICWVDPPWTKISPVIHIILFMKPHIKLVCSLAVSPHRCLVVHNEQPHITEDLGWVALQITSLSFEVWLQLSSMPRVSNNSWWCNRYRLASLAKNLAWLLAIAY